MVLCGVNWKTIQFSKASINFSINPFLQIILALNLKCRKELNQLYIPQTAATTFTFSSAWIILLWTTCSFQLLRSSSSIDFFSFCLSLLSIHVHIFLVPATNYIRREFFLSTTNRVHIVSQPTVACPFLVRVVFV